MTGVPLIRDLIEVPPVRTVIRLEEGRTSAGEIAASFVLTPEVTSHFAVLAEALLAGRGQGYFLQGDFGSGKSHFLAALYAWLAGGEARDSLGGRHGGLARLAESGRRYLPVDVSLVNFRATASLESIVADAIAARLPAGAVKPAAGDDRREAFALHLAAVKTAGYDGLVLLVDELSEFFRSKPTPQSLNEDARTLQLLGEMTGRHPLWIVAAVQESIEATGDVSQAILRKIKDRFPVRLGLTTLHVRSLIGSRLVRRQPGAEEEIARIHEHFRSQFASFTSTFDDFRACYPVHPVTLSLLEGLGDLFSQHRGIVDFVYARIAGDPARGIPGILDRPATELLGPDSIYEHFAQRLAEFSAFHAYPRRIVPHLDETIDTVLESAEDRALARRLVRMLVLYKVHPTAANPTVSQLAELGSCSLGAAEPSLNVRYVSEAVLEPVSRASRFLVRSLPVSGDPLQVVYAIALEQDPGKLFEARLRSATDEIAEDDGRLLVEPLAGMAESESWPGAAVWEEGARRSISWNSSIRTVLVRFLQGEAQEAFSDRLAFSIAEEGFDFAVVIAIGTVSVAVPHTALWTIPLPKKSAVLREYLAVRAVSARLSPSNPADAPLIPLAKERIARIAPAAFQAALETLYTGAFADPRIGVEPSVRQVRRFDRLLEAAADVLLQDRFPRFREVAPRKLAPSPRLYQQLLEGFVSPGSLSLTEARTRSLAPLIDGLAVPLGLVEIRRGAYVFSPDSSEYPLIPHLLSLLSPSGPTPLAQVLAGLQGSPFGLPRDTAVFLVAALVLGGLLAARRSGRAIPLDYLTLQSVEKADEITLGELVSEVDRETLVRECVFLPSLKGVESFGLRQQREAWKDVIRFRESALQLVSETRRSLGRIAEFSSFQAFGVEKVERTLSALSVLADGIRVSYQAKEGLEGFLRAWRGTGLASGDVLSLKKLSQFLQEKGEEFIFVSHYLRHPVVEKAAARDPRIAEQRAIALALLEAPEASVLSDGGEHLAEVFARLRDAYGAAYAREHTAWYESQKPPELSRDAARSLEVLKSLAGIESLDRPPGLEALLRELAAGDRPACRRRLSEELLRSPVCGCGFIPADAPHRPRASDPEKPIDDSLRQYCTILAQPRVLEAITARVFALRDASAPSVERLKKLAEILHRGGVSPAELVSAVDGDTAAELGRALAGRVVIRQRSLGELAARLAGRRLPPKTILSLVSEWIAEASEQVIISVGSEVPSVVGSPGSDPSRGTVPAADAPLAFWPLLHGSLLDKLTVPEAPQAEEMKLWEHRLESAFPAARLREVLLAADTAEVLSFIAREGLHAGAVRAAWLVVAERIARGGKLPAGFNPASRLADAEKAGQVRRLLAVLAREAGLVAEAYPRRLAVRLPVEDLLSDAWTTDELASALFRLLDQVSTEAEPWLASLPGVQPIPLDDSPVVIIADGISADVWLEALKPEALPHELAVAEISWARLDSAPSTAESLGALFSVSGDPQEQLAARGVPMLTLKGSEELSLKDRLLPLDPDRASVVRLTLFDKAAHLQTLRLSEMAVILRDILVRDLPPVLRACAQQGRTLILTADHGLSLNRKGLSHGRGGVYERTIFRGTWPPA
ncbi:MAG: DUF6079 family protein [Spirochaetes bacterium]|nr:DUF6079 family protein [Spirochaetota bacterium]